MISDDTKREAAINLLEAAYSILEDLHGRQHILQGLSSLCARIREHESEEGRRIVRESTRVSVRRATLVGVLNDLAIQARLLEPPTSRSEVVILEKIRTWHAQLEHALADGRNG